MNESQARAARFERHRSHLRAVAYRMLGSASEAEDAVQEAYLRLERTGDGGVDDLRAWLTTVVARVCLDMLRARRARREDSAGDRLPEPVVTVETGADPEYEAVLADSVGLAMLIVLDTLSPAERIAFVLHDMFSVPFGEIADLVDRSPEATRPRPRGARGGGRAPAPSPDADLRAQREVVDAFLAASREGDFEGLLAVLDPDVVFRLDGGGVVGVPRSPVLGAEAVAGQVLERGTRFAPFARPAIVNGAAGVIVARGPRPFAIVGFTVVNGRIAEIDLVADPRKVRAARRPVQRS